jgi:putative chitinase
LKWSQNLKFQISNLNFLIMRTLKLGDKGSEVKKLQQRLLDLGFSSGTPDGILGPITRSAISEFQRSKGLLVDGMAGAATLRALELITQSEYLGAVTVIPRVTIDLVAKMCPGTRRENIEQNLPFVLRALTESELVDKNMVLMALATIRVETGVFQPISESPSRYNTLPPGPPFNLYDNRADLGNQGPPDGENFRGRGFIQLTGRDNYQRYGQRLGLDNQLIENPELANSPQIAAQLLAAFIKDKEKKIRAALQECKFDAARRLVNGGTYGLAEFERTFKAGAQLI